MQSSWTCTRPLILSIINCFTNLITIFHHTPKLGSNHTLVAVTSVRINNTLSLFKACTLGVPQGSILGPLLLSNLCSALTMSMVSSAYIIMLTSSHMEARLFKYMLKSNGPKIDCSVWVTPTFWQWKRDPYRTFAQ